MWHQLKYNSKILDFNLERTNFPGIRNVGNPTSRRFSKLKSKTGIPKLPNLYPILSENEYLIDPNYPVEA